MISDDKYQIAWSLIEERFSNRREQFFVHIKQYMSILNIHTETASALLNVVDTIFECMRTFET